MSGVYQAGRMKLTPTHAINSSLHFSLVKHPVDICLCRLVVGQQ